MPGDADVVRCALPWLGAAARLLEAFAALGAGNWTVERICITTGLGIASGDAVQVLSGLAVAGVCVRSHTGTTWSSYLNHSELQRLAMLLRGAEQHRRLRLESPTLELVVTMPMSPSLLGEQLPGARDRPGGYLPTTGAFLRVATAAQSRLVVLTPFIDKRGFEWLKHVFEATNEEVEKILVLRDIDKYAVDLAVHHREWLHALRNHPPRATGY